MDAARAEAERERSKADAILTACELGAEDDVRSLLAAGATFACRDKAGRTPLTFAASNGHVRVVEMLLAHGVDADEDDELGRTPLHFAAMHDRADVVEILRARGAWVEAPDHADDTPLLLACRHAGVATVSALLRARANASATNKLKLTPLCEALVMRRRFDIAEALTREGGVDPIDERVDGGYTLLHAACAMDAADVVSWLLERGVTGDADDDDDDDDDDAKGPGKGKNKRARARAPAGITPLHCAAAAGAANAARALLADEKRRDACGPATAALFKRAARDDALTPSEEAKAACASVAEEIMAMAATSGPGTKKRTTKTKTTKTAATPPADAADVRAERAEAWAATPVADRKAKGVPPATWRALDAHADLAKEAELREFLLKLVEDDEFQVAMASARVRGAVEDVVKDFHNVKKYENDAAIMSVLGKFQRVQRFCKSRGEKISFKDVTVSDAKEAEGRRAEVARLKEGARMALETAADAADDAARADEELKRLNDVAVGGAGKSKETMKREDTAAAAAAAAESASETGDVSVATAREGDWSGLTTKQKVTRVAKRIAQTLLQQLLIALACLFITKKAMGKSFGGGAFSRDGEL